VETWPHPYSLSQAITQILRSWVHRRGDEPDEPIKLWSKSRTPLIPESCPCGLTPHGGDPVPLGHYEITLTEMEEDSKTGATLPHGETRYLVPRRP